MAALNASKGGSTADDDGRVATCWRPVGPCTSRSFAAAWSAGGYGGTDRLTTACGTLELRFERGSNVAMRPSACGRMRLVAELLLGPQSPCMLPPRTSLASRSTQMCYWSTLGYNRRRWQLSGQAPREVMISVHGIMTTGECNELASRCDLGVSRAAGMVCYRYQSLKGVYRRHI